MTAATFAELAGEKRKPKRSRRRPILTYGFVPIPQVSYGGVRQLPDGVFTTREILGILKVIGSPISPAKLSRLATAGIVTPTSMRVGRGVGRRQRSWVLAEVLDALGVPQEKAVNASTLTAPKSDSPAKEKATDENVTRAA